MTIDLNSVPILQAPDIYAPPPTDTSKDDFNLNFEPSDRKFEYADEFPNNGFSAYRGVVGDVDVGMHESAAVLAADFENIKSMLPKFDDEQTDILKKVLLIPLRQQRTLSHHPTVRM